MSGAGHSRDEFADIAAQRFRHRDTALTVPQPPVLEAKQLALAEMDPGAVFTPMEKMETLQ